jgi:LysR family transcriptional activator of nhaA
VSDVVPKHVAYRLLEPAFTFEPRSKIVVHEDHPEALLAELAVRHVDLVISDSPIPAAIKVKAFNHYLGHCGVAFLATEKLQKKYAKGFPASLSGAPILLPTDAAALRRDLDKWFIDNSIEPNIVAEFQDSALMKLVASQGHGIIPIADAVQSDVEKQYRLNVVGRTSAVQERFYLISVERRIKHPAVLAIIKQGASQVFGT